MSVDNNFQECKTEILSNGDVLVSPPYTNRGGINANTYLFQSTGNNGQFNKYKIPNKNEQANVKAGFIDWLNFSFKVEAFYKAFPDIDAITDSDEDIVYEISEKLRAVIGFGVTEKRASGLNFYDYSYNLGDNWGMLCIGGKHQRGTCSINLNGTGLGAIRELAWEPLLLDLFIKIDAKITRVDTTADFLKGEYTVDKAAEDYLAGNFNNGGSVTSARQAGNWLSPDGTGRTFYAGKKENGKELCIYEKGLQLGGNWAVSFKDWVRIELRFFSKDRIIPYDVLIKPGQYLSAGYPALNFISTLQCKIKTAKAKVQVEYEKAKAVLKHQFGAYIFAIIGVEGTLKDVMGDDIPKRLITPDLNYRVLSDMEDPYKISEDGALSMAFT